MRAEGIQMLETIGFARHFLPLLKGLTPSHAKVGSLKNTDWKTPLERFGYFEKTLRNFSPRGWLPWLANITPGKEAHSKQPPTPPPIKMKQFRSSAQGVTNIWGQETPYFMTTATFVMSEPSIIAQSSSWHPELEILGSYHSRGQP